MPGGRPVRPGSLLDRIAADPDRFSEISIVLAHTDATPKQRARARSAMIAAHPDEDKAIRRLPDDGMFIGWDVSDLARWRRSFVEFWMLDERLSPHDTVVLDGLGHPILRRAGDRIPARSPISDAYESRELSLSMRASSVPSETCAPSTAFSSATMPSNGACSPCSIFMASRISMRCPFTTF